MSSNDATCSFELSLNDFFGKLNIIKMINAQNQSNGKHGQGCIDLQC